jgi:hypothetical protein
MRSAGAWLERARAGWSYAASMSEEPGSDPIGDLQRWLMRAGARSVTREVTDRVRSTIGGAAGRSGKQADVWDTATTEAPTDEPPECQWCPICRAARRARDGSAPAAGLGGQFAGAADALAGLTRDAFSLFEAAMRTPPPRPAGTTPAGTAPAGTAPAGTAPAGTTPASTAPAGSTASRGTPAPSAPDVMSPPTTPETPDTPDPRTWVSSDDGTVVGPGVGWPTVVHPKHEHDEAAHESGDRQEGGEPGDRGPDGGGDQQVEGTAE